MARARRAGPLRLRRHAPTLVLLAVAVLVATEAKEEGPALPSPSGARKEMIKRRRDRLWARTAVAAKEIRTADRSLLRQTKWKSITAQSNISSQRGICAGSPETSDVEPEARVSHRARMRSLKKRMKMNMQRKTGNDLDSHFGDEENRAHRWENRREHFLKQNPMRAWVKDPLISPNCSGTAARWYPIRTLETLARNMAAGIVSEKGGAVGTTKKKQIEGVVTKRILGRLRNGLPINFASPTLTQQYCWGIVLGRVGDSNNDDDNKERFDDAQHIVTHDVNAPLLRRDILATSETGSGKTLGYLIPLLFHHMILESSRSASGLHSSASHDLEDLSALLHRRKGTRISVQESIRKLKLFDREGKTRIQFSNNRKGSINDGGIQNGKGLEENEKDAAPDSCVMVPTRELAMQIYVVEAKLLAAFGHTTGILIGGQGVKRQLQTLRYGGCDSLVGTPGRVLDIVGNHTSALGLNRVGFAVMDEADRLFSMGFQEEVFDVLRLLSPQRQTLLISATWPNSMNLYSDQMLNSPVRLMIRRFNDDEELDVIPKGTVDSSKKNAKTLRMLEASANVEQMVKVCSPESRAQRLLELLKQVHPPEIQNRILIFVRKKDSAEYVWQLLVHTGFPDTLMLHGDLPQEDRGRSLQKFRSNENSILVSTDLAARGIDVPNIACVINYEMPQNIEQYVHRIGRTGRAGKKGVSHSIFTKEDAPLAEKLVQVLMRSCSIIPFEMMQMREKSKALRKERNRRKKVKLQQKMLLASTRSI